MKSSNSWRGVWKWTNDIRGRAVLALGIIGLLVAGSRLIILQQTSGLATTSSQITQSHTAVNEVLAAANRNSDLTNSAFAYIRSGRQAFRLQYDQTGERLSTSGMANLSKQGYSNSSALKQLQTAGSQLQAVEQAALKDYDGGRAGEATALLTSDTYRSWENYFTNSARQFSSQETDNLSALKATFRRQWNEMITTYWASGLVIILACTILAWISVRSVIRPLLVLEQAAWSLSHGNLQTRVPITSKDELGRLAVAFNKMAVVLNEESMRSSERLEKITKDIGE